MRLEVVWLCIVNSERVVLACWGSSRESEALASLAEWQKRAVGTNDKVSLLAVSRVWENTDSISSYAASKPKKGEKV